MSLPKFTYCEPKTLEEAALKLAEYDGRARIVAGGTDLLLGMRRGIAKPEVVISLARIAGANAIVASATELRIGAMATLAEVAQHPLVQQHFPALACAAAVTGTVQIRNMGTVVGNICNASPSADTATPLLIYDAKMIVVAPGGERTVALAEFFRGPGKTALTQGELVKEIVLKLPSGTTRSNYQKLSPRSKVDIAIVGVSALLAFSETGAIRRARIAIGSVAPVPKRALEAENMLEGCQLTPEVIAAVAAVAAKEAAPITDMRASEDYRRSMVAVLTRRALQQNQREQQ